ncbi:MAG: hypothetical protein FWF88_06790 [Peptococcaceae bacterium]|nr:hypothetical protein [Peptococcaceae bacterium]
MIILENTVFHDVWLDALYDVRDEVGNGLARIRRDFVYRSRAVVDVFDDAQRMTDYLGFSIPVGVKGTGFNNKILLVARNGWIDDFEDSIFEILLHEFAHLAVAESFAEKCPLWLNEGLAIYYSGEAKYRDSQGFKADYPYYEKDYADWDLFYFQCAQIVFRLIEKYGEQDFVIHCRKCRDFINDSIVGAENLRRF